MQSTNPDAVKQYRQKLCKRIMDGLTEDGVKALMEMALSKRESCYKSLAKERDPILAAEIRGRIDQLEWLSQINVHLENELQIS